MAGTLVVSLDFELYWGMHDIWPLSSYAKNLAGVPRAVASTLALFKEFNVHATWATVGLIGCANEKEAVRFTPRVRPAYLRDAANPFRLLDGSVEPRYLFAPHLVQAIGHQEGQELATHTFSHFSCLEPGHSLEAFRADLRASLDVLSNFGPRPKSVVFGRNRFSLEHLAVCAEEGICFFRGSPSSEIYDLGDGRVQQIHRRFGRLFDAHLPLIGFDRLASHPRTSRRLVDIPASRFLRPHSRCPVLPTLALRRVLGELREAARSERGYHLWWHPHNAGHQLLENMEQLRQILETFSELRAAGQMRSLNMSEWGAELLSSS